MAWSCAQRGHRRQPRLGCYVAPVHAGPGRAVDRGGRDPVRAKAARGPRCFWRAAGNLAAILRQQVACRGQNRRRFSIPRHRAQGLARLPARHPKAEPSAACAPLSRRLHGGLSPAWTRRQGILDRGVPVGLITMFLSSTLGTPSIPSERRGFQLLRMAPMTMWQLLRAKVMLSLLPVLVFTLVFSVVIAAATGSGLGQFVALPLSVVWPSTGFVSLSA